MLPFETILAVSPPSAEVKLGLFRTLRLRPMTLTHAVAMEAFGCSLDGNLDDSHSLIAAWILSRDSRELTDVIIDSAKPAAARRMVRFVRAVAKKTRDVRDAVNRHVEISFKTYVQGRRADRGSQLMASGPEGFGWPLEIAEHLCGEYGWSFDQAMNVPVARALALVSVGRIRLGGESGGPDYYQRIEIENLKKSRAFAAAQTGSRR